MVQTSPDDDNRRNDGKFESVDPSDYERETEPVGETAEAGIEVPEDPEEAIENFQNLFNKEADEVIDNVFGKIRGQAEAVENLDLSEVNLEDARNELKKAGGRAETRVDEVVSGHATTPYSEKGTAVETSLEEAGTAAETSFEEVGTAVETPNQENEAEERVSGAVTREITEGHIEIPLEDGSTRELPEKIEMGETDLINPQEIDSGGMKEIFSYEDEETGEKKAVAFSKKDEVKFSLDEAITLSKLSETEDIVDLDKVFGIDSNGEKFNIDIEELERLGTEEYMQKKKTEDGVEFNQIVIVEEFLEGQDLSQEKLDVLDEEEEQEIEQNVLQGATEILNEEGIEGLKRAIKDHVGQSYNLEDRDTQKLFEIRLENKKEEYSGSSISEEEVLIKLFTQEKLRTKTQKELSKTENIEEIDENIEHFNKAVDQLSQVHEEGVSHNDVKAANIIEGNVLDFGMSESHKRVGGQNALVSGSRRNKEAAAMFWEEEDINEENRKDKDTRALILTAFDKLVSESLETSKMNDLIGEGDYEGYVPPGNPETVRPHQDIAFELLQEVGVPDEVLASIAHFPEAEESRDTKPDVESAGSAFLEWHQELLDDPNKIKSLDVIMDYLSNPAKMQSLSEKNNRGDHQLTENGKDLFENIRRIMNKETDQDITYEQCKNNSEAIFNKLNDNNNEG